MIHPQAAFGQFVVVGLLSSVFLFVCLSICVAEGTVHCVLLSWCYGWKSNTAVITETHTPPLTHNTVTVISSLDDYVSVFAVVKHKDLGTIV